MGACSGSCDATHSVTFDEVPLQQPPLLRLQQLQCMVLTAFLRIVVARTGCLFMDGADWHHPFRFLAATGLLPALNCDVEGVGQFSNRQGWLASLELLLLQLLTFDVSVPQPLGKPG